MTLPRVLVIDDQYARDPGTRSAFLRQVGSIEIGVGVADRDTIAEICFCSGQRRDGNLLVNDLDEARKAAGKAGWALVLLDLRFDSGVIGPDGRPEGAAGDATFGEEVRRALGSEHPMLPLVMLSTSHQSELPQTDVAYFSKETLSPLRMRRKLLEAGRLTREQAATLLRIPADVIAVADTSREAFRKALSFAETEAPVLLLGETGTGKEVLANYIHANSRRSSEPFEAFDLGAAPPTLVEDLIFGHERGAFDGARAPAESAFEKADGGTLFLDEIGEVSHETQGKLLRVLESKKFRRLGGGAVERGMNVRLITATSRSTDVFRPDFYERIGVLVLELPRLADRREDIIPLARLYLSKAMLEAGTTGISLSPGANAALADYEFPRNVRELRNIMTRIVTLADNNALISAREVAAAIRSQDPGPAKLAVPTLPRGEPKQEAPTPISAERRSPAGTGLAAIVALLREVVVEEADPQIEGLLPRLDDEFTRLRRRLTAAALQRCRNPVTGALNRQAAVQYLFGDRSLTAGEPKRRLNAILGKNQTSQLDDKELEQLIREGRVRDDAFQGEE